jgi:hypothetical protein
MKLYVIKVPIKQTLVYHVHARDLAEAVKKHHNQHPDCSKVCAIRGWYNPEGRTTFEEIPLKADLPKGDRGP